jgi:hypothetical protein
LGKVIVLGKNSYEAFPTKDGGTVPAGIKVAYIDEKPVTEGGQVGFMPMTTIIKPEHEKSFEVLPGLYDMEYGHKPGPGGRPIAFVSSVKYLKPVIISPGA